MAAISGKLGDSIEHEGSRGASTSPRNGGGFDTHPGCAIDHRRNKEALEIATKTVRPWPSSFLAAHRDLFLGASRPETARRLDHESSIARPKTSRHSPAAASAARPLVAAINKLLFRLNGSLWRTNAVLADAAHELRTPIAAARVQTQVALLTPDADKRNPRALAQTLAGLDRATHLVEQMLRTARLDPLAVLPDPTPLDLSEPDAQRHRQSTLDSLNKCAIEVDIDDRTIVVESVADLLQVALRNLIDNAVRYSPEGSRIAVALHTENGRPVIRRRRQRPRCQRGGIAAPRRTFLPQREVVAEGAASS